MSNGIKWQFEEPSLYSYDRVDELTKAIRETGVVKETENSLVYGFCIALVHTRGVTFDASRVKSDSLRKLPEFLETWEALSPLQLWEYRRKNISHPLWKQWANTFAAESDVLLADPAELPEAMLTDEQRETLKDPSSFLALPGKSLPKS